jgi:hypothetical protein
LNELGPNLIRTYVPVVVGAVVAWLTARGIHVNAGTTSQAIIAMTAVFTSAYYTIARVVEEKFPGLGAVLLGHRPAQAVAAADPFDDPDHDEGPWPPEDEHPTAALQPSTSQAAPTRIYVDPAPAPMPPVEPAGQPGQSPGPVPLPPSAQMSVTPPVRVGPLEGLAGLVARTPPTPPGKPRGPRTGAIPIYKRPPGR